MSVVRTQYVFDYVDRTGVQMIPFFRTPKFLLEDPFFDVLSNDAILLYAVLQDRLELSLSNDWFDENGRAFVIYPLKEIQKIMRCGHDKATKLLRELDTEHGIGLIERKKGGLGRPNIIYVKTYRQECGKAAVQDAEMSHSGMLDTRTPEVGKTAPSKTNTIKTEYSETERVMARHRHGAYHNVLLSEEELHALKTEFPDDYEERIETLSEYIASKGAKYKNHLATIRSWDRRERRERERRFRHENYETEDTL